MDGKNFEVITLGNIFNENINFTDRNIGPLLGGTVAYSSVVLGRLGIKVGIVSNAGTDIPITLIDPIMESGVDITGLHIKGDIETNTNILIYDEKGNKQIKYLKKAPKITIKDIPQKYYNTTMVYLCPVDFDILPETIGLIKERVGLIVADLGGFGGAHCSEESRIEFKKDRSRNLETYLSYFDIAKVSMEDCYHLFNDFEITERYAIEKLLDSPLEILILTLGKQGSLIAKKGQILQIPALPARVVDTTGAGDTFMAAFIAEYVKGTDIKDCGQFASAASSILVESTGGVNIERIPNRRMVIDRLKINEINDKVIGDI